MLVPLRGSATGQSRPSKRQQKPSPRSDEEPAGARAGRCHLQLSRHVKNKLSRETAGVGATARRGPDWASEGSGSQSRCFGHGYCHRRWSTLVLGRRGRFGRSALSRGQVRRGLHWAQSSVPELSIDGTTHTAGAEVAPETPGLANDQCLVNLNLGTPET